MEYRLLEKTELWIHPVKLEGADLGSCAEAAASVLGLKPREIMVTDVFEDRLTLDVLVPTIRGDQIIAREKALLDALAAIPGIQLTPETQVHSAGILGLIRLDEKIGQEVMKRSRAIKVQSEERIRRRSMIFSTGKEVLNQQICDRNTPFLAQVVRGEGYFVTQGPTLEDFRKALMECIKDVRQIQIDAALEAHANLTREQVFSLLRSQP